MASPLVTHRRVLAASLVGTAVVIFVFRALPTPGAGQTWWMIDVLKFDESFLAQLSLLTYVLTLVGMFAAFGFLPQLL